MARVSFVAIFAGVGLLGIVEIYGVIACIVTQRTREIGMEMGERGGADDVPAA